MMHAAALAERNVADVLRPREGGKVINPTVVTPVRPVEPNYSAMREVISGGKKGKHEKKNEREKQPRER